MTNQTNEQGQQLDVQAKASEGFDDYLPLRPSCIGPGEWQIFNAQGHFLWYMEGASLAEWICEAVNQHPLLSQERERREAAERERDEAKGLIPRLAKAEHEADKYRLALESLTPGGSEFVGDSIACVAHVQQRRKEQWALISELQQSLASERDRHKEELEFITGRANALYDEAQRERNRWYEEKQRADKAEARIKELEDYACEPLSLANASQYQLDVAHIEQTMKRMADMEANLAESEARLYSALCFVPGDVLCGQLQMKAAEFEAAMAASAEANTRARNKALEEARQIALEDLDPKCRAHGCDVCETRKSIADRILTLIEQAGEQR
jgi:hypothetical protein